MCASRSFFKAMRGMRAYPGYNNSNGVIGRGYPGYTNAKCASDEGGVGIAVPTNVSGKRDMHVHRGKRPKIGKKPEKSLLIRIGMSERPVFRERSVRVFSAITVSFTITALNNSIGVPAMSKSILCAMGPKAGASAGMHLGKGKIPSLEGARMEKSRCMALIVRAPRELDTRTGRTLEGFSRLDKGALRRRSSLTAGSRGSRGGNGGGKFVSGVGRTFRSGRWGR